MIQLDQWHDYLRLAMFLVNAGCLLLLIRRYMQQSNHWNVKTRDYWYALFMWCLAGCVLTAQGVVLDRPFTPAVVFVTAASLASLKGLLTKGAWGGTA